MKNITKVRILGALALAGAVTYFGYAKANSTESTASHQQKQTNIVATEMPVVEYHYSLDREYSSLKELKENSKFIIVADHVDRAPARMDGGMVETFHKFYVRKVIKGSQDILNTDITINQTGGFYEGKKYVGEGDTLFEDAQYLLYLQMQDNIYFRTAIGSGMYKLDNLKVTQLKSNASFDAKAPYLKNKISAFGGMKVRKQAENMTGEELLNEVINN